MYGSPDSFGQSYPTIAYITSVTYKSSSDLSVSKIQCEKSQSVWLYFSSHSCNSPTNSVLRERILVDTGLQRWK